VQRVTLILPSAFAEDPAGFDGTRLDLRDPDYIREVMPRLDAVYRYYFRVRATGFERTRMDGPFLMVGNHNGGINGSDSAMTLRAINLYLGPERPLYALVHPTIFTYPYLNVHAQKLGGIAATARMALRALEAGAPLFIYPGAGDDAYKPYERRHRIDFFRRDAFVRLALRFRLPILPVVSVGAHETLVVFDDGRERAAEWGLTAQGIERLPLSWTFPDGLTLGMGYSIPLPARIALEMGPPILFPEHGAATARDAEVVRRCYSHVVATMQAIMDRMVRERIDLETATTLSGPWRRRSRWRSFLRAF
jgi:1-acyl-sn-glycerol-3-phosphate acyltransferase